MNSMSDLIQKEWFKDHVAEYTNPQNSETSAMQFIVPVSAV